MKTYKIHWLDGREEVMTGDSIGEAFDKAGYGEDFLYAVDWFENIQTIDAK